VRNDRGGDPRPLDLAGFFLSGLSLSALLYGTELASQQHAELGPALGFVVAGLAVGGLAWWHARGRVAPLLDYSTLKVPTFRVTVVTGSISRIGIEAVPYLLPLMFQLGFGLSAFQSGLLMMGSALGNLSMKAFVNRFMRRFGFRNVTMVNATVAGLLMIGCGLLFPDTPLVVLLAVLFAYGLSRSLHFSTLAALAYADIDDKQKSPASTLWSVAQQMTIGLGIAFGALALRAVSSVRGEALPADAHFALADFHWAFFVAGFMVLCTAFGYARMSADAGASIGGGSTRPRP
jgi:MFS family permease